MDFRLRATAADGRRELQSVKSLIQMIRVTNRHRALGFFKFMEGPSSRLKQIQKPKDFVEPSYCTL